MTGEKQVERWERSAPLSCLLLSSGLMFSSFPPLTLPSKMLSTQHLFRLWALPAPNHSVPFSAMPLSLLFCLLALSSLTPSPLTSLYTFKIQLWCPFSRNLDGVWRPFPFAFHGALGRSLPVFHHSMPVPSRRVLRKFLLTDWWKGRQKVKPNVPT